MEYMPVWVSHPSWLTLQLPHDVAALVGYHPDAGARHDTSRSITFLARGPRVVRVVATQSAREGLAVEGVSGRLVATARPGDRRILTLPNALLRYLGVRVTVRGERGARGTDDGLTWFAPAPEFYEYRSVVQSGRPFTGLSSGPFAHVYLTSALLPLPREYDRLAENEQEIEEHEWRPAVRLLQRVGRGRRG